MTKAERVLYEHYFEYLTKVLGWIPERAEVYLNARDLRTLDLVADLGLELLSLRVRGEASSAEAS